VRACCRLDSVDEFLELFGIGRLLLGALGLQRESRLLVLGEQIACSFYGRQNVLAIRFER